MVSLWRHRSVSKNLNERADRGRFRDRYRWVDVEYDAEARTFLEQALTGMDQRSQV
ncbi:MAG: hypothetical protein ACE5KY_00370 [Candidatus Tectimicrobiota bacterium]